MAKARNPSWERISARGGTDARYAMKREPSIQIWHCGHPTANWPYHGVITRDLGGKYPLDECGLVVSPNGIAFQNLAMAQAAMEHLWAGNLALTIDRISDRYPHARAVRRPDCLTWHEEGDRVGNQARVSRSLEVIDGPQAFVPEGAVGEVIVRGRSGKPLRMIAGGEAAVPNGRDASRPSGATPGFRWPAPWTARWTAAECPNARTTVLASFYFSRRANHDRQSQNPADRRLPGHG